jgi:hypothetical protein
VRCNKLAFAASLPGIRCRWHGDLGQRHRLQARDVQTGINKFLIQSRGRKSNETACLVGSLLNVNP